MQVQGQHSTANHIRPPVAKLGAYRQRPREGRCLLYVAARPDAALLDMLDAEGWKVVPLQSMARFGAAAREAGTGVGLVDFSACPVRDLAAIEDMLRHSQFVWVAAVGSRSIADAGIRRLVRSYCFDYVTLPADQERVAGVLGHALGMAALQGDQHVPADDDAHGDCPMVGRCEAMQKLTRSIRKVAKTSAPVFISGESGTGKELTAVAIHQLSPRCKGPFVTINCGAIAHHLLHSELFGFERGAFTGATERKIGRVESANGGTLFLDEIGDLPREMQASLLRFLQEGTIERLGGNASIPVDVRIVSATHVDLEAAVAAGRFREDLYHRLCVLRLEEPPLRMRGKDIELLAHYVLHKYKGESPRAIRGFSPCALEAMQTYAWPGNVRELINCVRRAIVMSEGRLLTAADLGLAGSSTEFVATLVQAREVAEKAAIEASLLRHRERINQAAVELGVSRSTLYRLMIRYGMRDAMPDSESESSDDEGQGGH